MSALLAKTSRTSKILRRPVLNFSIPSRFLSNSSFNQTRRISKLSNLQTLQIANKCLLYNNFTQKRSTSFPLLPSTRQIWTSRRITSASTANGKIKSSNKTSPSRSFTSSAPLSAKEKVKKYKLKTNHAAAKRWKAISNAMFKRRRQGRSHFMVKKSASRANSLGKDVLAAPYHVRALKKLLPYA